MVVRKPSRSTKECIGILPSGNSVEPTSSLTVKLASVETCLVKLLIEATEMTFGLTDGVPVIP